MSSNKNRQALQIAIIVLGCASGWFFLAPLLPNKPENAVLIGGLIALLINIIIFRDLRNKLFEQPSKERIERLKKERSLGFRRSLLHPTNLPFHLAIVLFIGCALLLGFLKIKPTDTQLSTGLIIFLLLVGLSGFLMLIRNEYVDTNGRILNGLAPIINGIALLLAGEELFGF